MDAYLEGELRRLDLLLHCEILRLRARYQLSLDEFRGLYVSDQQVDALVRDAAGQAPDISQLAAQAALLRAEPAGNWAALELSPFEHDVLLLALARELKLKYETLYGYLHNDVTRKKPTVELALRVFGHAGRNALLPEGRLLAGGLITASGDGFLARELDVPLPVVRYLTGLEPESKVPRAAASNSPLLAATETLPRLYIVESPSVEAARAALESVCAVAGRRLLPVDLEAASENAARVRLLQRLEHCAVCVLHLANVIGCDQRIAGLRRFFHELESPAEPVWVLLPPDANWRGVIPAHAVRVVRMPHPHYDERLAAWNAEVRIDTARELAARYSLGGREIASSAAYARDLVALSGGAREPGLDDVREAVRSQSESTIGRFARRLVSTHSWDDLVLPGATLRQVREAAEAIRHRHTVLGTWGFGRKHSAVDGLKILFAGGSGTGKTMTAGVIGNHLGLDVFRIDLSGVVSKYIGETEKNLDRVFAAAAGSESILFFDEADALFGKRSEVKDAHDRYANIEVAYLLQKFEDHGGPVILATNLRRNLDEAFARRLNYVIEFPPPDEPHRLRLWRGVFPAQTPLTDVDFGFLAAQFPLTGGDIRNVALDAAFLAAQDGGVVTMRQITVALSRQLLKQGKAPSAADFKHFYALLA